MNSESQVASRIEVTLEKFITIRLGAFLSAARKEMLLTF